MAKIKEFTHISQTVLLGSIYFIQIVRGSLALFQIQIRIYFVRKITCITVQVSSARTFSNWLDLIKKSWNFIEIVEFLLFSWRNAFMKHYGYFYKTLPACKTIKFPHFLPQCDIALMDSMNCIWLVYMFKTITSKQYIVRVYNLKLFVMRAL